MLFNPRVSSAANPDFLSNELLYQFQMTKASLMLVHPDSLTVSLEVAREAGLSSDSIVLFNSDDGSKEIHRHETINSLIDLGLTDRTSYIERVLAPGEAKTKLAFLAFSSGTTGRPKVEVQRLPEMSFSDLSRVRLWQFRIILWSQMSFKWPLTTRLTKTTVTGKINDIDLEILQVQVCHVCIFGESTD